MVALQETPRKTFTSSFDVPFCFKKNQSIDDITDAARGDGTSPRTGDQM